jgi:hypothetical protein
MNGAAPPDSDAVVSVVGSPHRDTRRVGTIAADRARVAVDAVRDVHVK